MARATSGRLLFVEQCIDPGSEVFNVEWFVEVFVGARLHGGLMVVWIGQRGDDNDGRCSKE